MNRFSKSKGVVCVLVLCGFGLLVVAALAQENKPPNQTPQDQAKLPVVGEWPLAPVYIKSAMKEPHGAINPPEIETPSASPPPVNPLLQIATSAFDGEMVYTPRLQVGQPMAQRYCVFQNLSQTKSFNGRPSDAATYHMKTGWRVWDPQLSPDKKILLFKVGDTPDNSYESYGVFLWDFGNKTLKRMKSPNNLNFRRLYWSPNSNFIAFVSGGDRYGNVPAYFKPLQLHIYNVQTGQEHMVVENPGVTRMAWTNQNTLLFTLASPEELKKIDETKDDDERAQLQENLRTAIYEVAPEEGSEAKMVVPNGFYPQPSPDGKWIAYVAEPLPKKKGEKPEGEDGQDVPRKGLVVNGRISSGIGFYLWNRQTQKRTLIGPADLNYFRWTPDSAHLVTLQETYKRIGKGEKTTGEGLGAIRVVDVPSLTSRDVTTLHAKDYAPNPHDEIWPQFEPQVSNDGKTLFVKQSEFIKEEHGYQTEHKSLIAVDLATGKTVLLARLLNKYNNIIGWDFHDDSPVPAPVAAK